VVIVVVVVVAGVNTNPCVHAWVQGEDLFKDKCADSATREWIVETYTRRPSLAECLMTSPAPGGSLKRSLSLSQAGRTPPHPI
jgi:hypothetical protein